MDVFKEYLDKIVDKEQKDRVEKLFTWIFAQYPTLKGRIAWNQPMFTDHDTFILGFSMSKQHLSVSPEPEGIAHFSDKLEKVGYSYTTNLFRIKWSDVIDYNLIQEIIEFNITEKADITTFWRK